MTYASVAIVGRPNVGKSTLFNSLVGSRIAIEAATAGVTRDRVLFPLTIEDTTFDLIDTGGIGIVDLQNLSQDVEKQITIAINEATIIIFVVDCRDGITPLDEDVADRLRRCNKPVLLVANKADTHALEEQLPSFHKLGFGDALAISAKQRRNISDLEEAILAQLPEEARGNFTGDKIVSATAGLLKIAFVGRRNVGKSSIINNLCGAERTIVSDTPGTTRDSLDIIIERDGEKFVAIDTAGLRKRGQMDDIMEFYGHLRAERAVRRADVVILMLDVTQEISRVDKRLGSLIVEEHKPCIVVLNKWDLAREKNPAITVDAFQKYLADQLPGLWFCPLAGVSAKDGTNVWDLVITAKAMAAMAKKSVGTGQLNAALTNAQKKRHTKTQYGKVGKIYYGTQSETAPPTFILFCNNPSYFDDSFRRFLENHLRQELGFAEIPLRLIFKTTKEKQIGRYK